MIHNMYRGMLTFCFYYSSCLLFLVALLRRGQLVRKVALKIAVDSRGTYEYLYKDYIDACLP